MGSPERRDRARLWAEILAEIRRAERAGERPVPTRIQHAVNAPTARFREYLDELERQGLLRPGPDLALTERGEAFLAEYARVRAFLRQFGLLPGDDGGPP